MELNVKIIADGPIPNVIKALKHHISTLERLQQSGITTLEHLEEVIAGTSEMSILPGNNERTKTKVSG